MDRYYVNTNPQYQQNNEHEVHRTNSNCPTHALPQNQDDLGWHSTCRDAIAAARAKGYRPVDGCAHCVPDCHTM